VLKGVGQFWYDFVIGDDWKIACGVALILLVGAGCVLAGLGDRLLLAPLLAVGVAGAFVTAVLIDVRESR
jgi:hypothetical protein